MSTQETTSTNDTGAQTPQPTRKYEKTGMSKTGTYNSYQMMRQRCNNPNHIAFERYGAAGITVCKEWDESFEAFLRDMGPRPEGKTLGRIDGKGNYEPGNCEWQTDKEQANNKSTNVYIEYRGTVLTATRLAERFGLKPGNLLARLRAGTQAEDYIARHQPQPMFTADDQPNYHSPETRREIASCLQVIYEIAPMVFSVDDVAKVIEKCQRQTYRLMKGESTPSVEVARRMESFLARILKEHRFMLPAAA